MRKSVHMEVTSGGDDIGVFVDTDGNGGVRLMCLDGSGDTQHTPLMTPEEARKLASLLTEIAEFCDAN